jgi:hypothetical protein
MLVVIKTEAERRLEETQRELEKANLKVAVLEDILKGGQR